MNELEKDELNEKLKKSIERSEKELERIEIREKALKQYRKDLLEMIEKEKSVSLPPIPINPYAQVHYLELFCQTNGIEDKQLKIFEKYKNRMQIKF